jgi:TRAP-type mannitol/chloroaromatic compound transport system permease large subunit
MSDPVIAVAMLGVLVLLILLGFPICFTLMALGVGVGYYAYYEPERMDSLFDNNVFNLFVNQTYSVMSSDVLTAIPLFLFMGYLVERANIVSELFRSLAVATHRIPGSMAVAALITCALFATATGIVGAVVTLMGLLAYPSMLRAGYNVNLASGVICAGGTLGILIPPSIMLIVYGATSSVSVVQLYAGAFLPGFLLAGLYIVYVVIRAIIQPHDAPRAPRETWEGVSRSQLLRMLATSFLPLAVLILSVLGAILAGWATPSEAAAIGALGGLTLAATYQLHGFFKGTDRAPPWSGWRLEGGQWGLMPSLAFGAFAAMAILLLVVLFGMFFGFAPGITGWPAGLWVAVTLVCALLARSAAPLLAGLLSWTSGESAGRVALVRVTWTAAGIAASAKVLDWIVVLEDGDSGEYAWLDLLLQDVHFWALLVFAVGAVVLVFAIGLAWVVRNLSFGTLETQFLRLCGLAAPLGLGLAVVFVLVGLAIGLEPSWRMIDAFTLGFPLAAAVILGTKWQGLRESVYLTVRTSAMVCWLFVGSWTFASVFAYLGGQQVIADFVTGLDLSPLMFMILAQFIIFLLGWPLEWSEITIIFVPIFLPLLPHFGIDPLFFGIMVALNLQTAFLSPPMAMSAYYLKGIAPPHVRLTQIFSGSMPFMLIVVLSMIIIYIFPGIVHWLPEMAYG